MKKVTKSILSLIIVISVGFTSVLAASASIKAEAETKAAALKQLGLFNGVSAVGTDFALNRAPTRTEALVMLIRTLGRESEALNGSWSHPFTDVAQWADKYVGYGYEKGLTTGISATEFGTGNANCDMYLTFILRALGYSDKDGDFVWDSPDGLAKAVGILTDDVNTVDFKRQDIAIISWSSLEADIKAGGQRLAKKLMSEGVFTSDEHVSAIELVNAEKEEPITVKSADELKVILEANTSKNILLDSIGNPFVLTGEVTIPFGVTVTVNRGNDFYIEGSLINNGTVEVMGSDTATENFINYSVMAVQKGGKVLNNGSLRLCRSIIVDEEDRGPVGGQLRIFDGSFTNEGAILLQSGRVNTHGGVIAVVEGTLKNYSTVVCDGFFIRVTGGSFENSKGGVIINSTTIMAEEPGKFINNGTIKGIGVNN